MWMGWSLTFCLGLFFFTAKLWKLLRSDSITFASPPHTGHKHMIFSLSFAYSTSPVFIGGKWLARPGLSCWLPSLLGSNLSPMYTALGVQRPLLTSAQPLLCTQALNGTYKSRGRQGLGDKREAGDRLQKGSESQHTSLSQLCPPPAVVTAKEDRANKTK